MHLAFHFYYPHLELLSFILKYIPVAMIFKSLCFIYSILFLVEWWWGCGNAGVDWWEFHSNFKGVVWWRWSRNDVQVRFLSFPPLPHIFLFTCTIWYYHIIYTIKDHMKCICFIKHRCLSLVLPYQWGLEYTDYISYSLFILKTCHCC